MHPMLIVAIIGVVLLLIAWGLWATVRSLDRRNALIAAAAPLPIKLVNVWDRVWIRGEIDCDDPKIAPHFGYSCVHFHYKLEEQVTRVEHTSKGTRVKTEWRTRDEKTAAVRFRVVQDGRALLVHAEKAEWFEEQSESVTLGDWRHTCTYTLSWGPISVVGVVGETKDSLEPLGHTPLIVTPAERKPFLEQVETNERRVAGMGLVLLFLGAALAIYGLWRKAQVGHPDPHAAFWHDVPQHVEWWDPGLAGLAALVALIPTLLFWSIRAYNNLVNFRTRADMAWSHVDVHLKQRYDLIPRLVEVVRGYGAYEQKTLEDLTLLRGQAAGGRAELVGSEVAAVDAVTRVLALAEAYPELHANELYQKLAEQITALEDKIAHGRGFFNDAVAEYNTHTASFPSNLIAGVCGFGPLPLFAAALEERAVPHA
jgi:LemA protein